MCCFVQRLVFSIIDDKFFFFNDTATTEIYTLSLHDALPISPQSSRAATTCAGTSIVRPAKVCRSAMAGDRKSTRLNSSHSQISYAVFCLKKKITRPDAFLTYLAHPECWLADLDLDRALY